MKPILYFLFTLVIFPLHVFSQTALIATVESSGTKPLVHGVQALYDSLSSLNWRVETLAGVQPTAAKKADLEIFAAISNETLDRLMADFSIPSYDVASKDGSYSFITDKTGAKNRIFVVGSDWNGVMYGLFELSSRINAQKPGTSSSFSITNEKRSPTLKTRGVACYLHTKALHDPFSWFHEDKYWDGFIKQLAMNTFNYLELRGAFDSIEGDFKNLFPYFTPGQSFNDNTITEFVKEKNLQRLKMISDMASEYGIEVSLINYKASLLDPSSMQEVSNQVNTQYTQTAIQLILQNCPNLSGMGFRTGESGKNESFYRAVFLPSLNATSRNTVLTVHPWLSDEYQIRMMMDTYESKSKLVFKFNGDHLVHPYPVSGYRMSEWHSYSYESYFSNPHRYEALFQISTGGTNRIFPWMDAEFVKQTVKSCQQFNADGIVVECPSPYTQPYEMFLHSVEQEIDVWEYQYQRDWYWYQVWGKLAYEPDRNLEGLMLSFKERFGPNAGEQLFEALQKASHVIPALAAVYYPAPDVRSYSPEFEPPLSIMKWMEAQPLDMLTVRSVQEEINSRVSRSVNAKRSPLQFLTDAETDAQEASELSKNAGQLVERLIESGLTSANKKIHREWIYLDANIQALAALSRYLRTSLETALQFGMFQLSGDTPSLLIASETTKGLMAPWQEFQQQMRRLYSPVYDAVRIDHEYFHWSNMSPTVIEDQQIMANAYLAWQESDSWKRYLGHNRQFTARTEVPFILTCSIPPGMKVNRLNVRYKNSFGQTGNVAMAPSTVEGIYAVEIDSGVMTAGAFEYFILGDIDGTPYKVPADTDGSFYTVSVTPDIDPPSVIDLNDQISISRDRLAIVGNFFDPSGIISSRIYWKSLPSDSIWEDRAMNLSGNEFVANIPVTVDGALYTIEIIDGVGNGIRIPDIKQGVPYYILPPYSGDEEGAAGADVTSPTQSVN
jgi:hypothetical protein